jgi:hypothetical protein
VKTFGRLDGRHKLAVAAAMVAWAVSVMFSQVGFGISSPKVTWLGWILAGIVTVVELVFNTSTKKLSMTLVVTGILCYVYGVWTNITGFWEFQHPGELFTFFSSVSVLPIILGSILEILPEPLFMWGIGSAFEGDLLGNLAGLWNGNLSMATPGEEQPRSVGYPQPNSRPNNNPHNNPQRHQTSSPSPAMQHIKNNPMAMPGMGGSQSKSQIKTRPDLPPFLMEDDEEE